MPYIDEVYRREIDQGRPPITAGDLAYSITRDIQRFIGPSPPSYSVLALVAGVLVLTLFEFVRRVVFPYEDRKIKENGDVFERVE